MLDLKLLNSYCKLLNQVKYFLKEKYTGLVTCLCFREIIKNWQKQLTFFKPKMKQLMLLFVKSQSSNRNTSVGHELCSKLAVQISKRPP